MPQNIANYYEASSGARFLMLGLSDAVAVYDRKGSPWKRLNGQPINVTDPNSSLRGILDDPNTRKYIKSQHPAAKQPFVGTTDDLVMVMLTDYDAFSRAAAIHLNQT